MLMTMLWQGLGRNECQTIRTILAHNYVDGFKAFETLNELDSARFCLK